MTKDLIAATQETAEWMDMIAERIPGLRPVLEEKKREMAEHIMAAFQPLFDLADGKITQEEFATIMAEREAKELAQREARWGEANDLGEWEVDAGECVETDCTRMFDDMIFDELPPLYPSHEDFDGVSCVEDDDDDEEEEDDQP